MPRFYFSKGRGAETSRFIRQPVWLLEAGIIGGLLLILRALPLTWANAFGSRIGWLIGRFSPRVTKVKRNLSVVFPGIAAAKLKRITRASFRNVGVAVAELATLDRIWEERYRRLEFRVLPGGVTPQASNRTIFVTAHLGAWQLTPLVGPYYGLDVPIIYAPEQNPYVDRLLTRLRGAFRGELVSRDGGIRTLMRALDKGQSIGMTVDTRMDKGDLVPFFGEQALTNTTPARLALRYGCEVVPVIAERLAGARYRVDIHPPIRSRDPGASARDQALDMSTQINALFEQWILEHPEQWVCLKRRWPKPVHMRYA